MYNKKTLSGSGFIQQMQDNKKPRSHSLEAKSMTFETSKASSPVYCLVLGHTPLKRPIPFAIHTLELLRSNDFSLSFLFNHRNLI